MSRSHILDDLTKDVEDLLGKLGTDLSPDLRELRDRLGNGIAERRRSAARAGAEASSAVRNYVALADDYLHDSPWLAIGAAAAAAGVIGFMAGNLLASNRRGRVL